LSDLNTFTIAPLSLNYFVKIFEARKHITFVLH
jgi:hypothetical protein